MPRRRTIDIPDPELTDAQWQKLAPWPPDDAGSPPGGPQPTPNRAVVEGILWVLRNGVRWKALPAGYPSYSTCWRRLRDWEDEGVRLDVCRASSTPWRKGGGSAGTGASPTAGSPR